MQEPTKIILPEATASPDGFEVFPDDASQGMATTQDEMAAKLPTEPAIPAWHRNLNWLYRQPGKHVRTGYTKNHGQGTPKAKRTQAKLSRRINRERA